jgi:hypothetical protein
MQALNAAGSCGAERFFTWSVSLQAVRSRTSARGLFKALVSRASRPIARPQNCSRCGDHMTENHASLDTEFHCAGAMVRASAGALPATTLVVCQPVVLAHGGRFSIGRRASVEGVVLDKPKVRTLLGPSVALEQEAK